MVCFAWTQTHVYWLCVQVIVVDVEDRDDSVWHNLTPFDGGLSGWRLLWDRWCPIPRFRSVSCSMVMVRTPFHGLG